MSRRLETPQFPCDSLLRLAVQGESTGRTDAAFGDGDGVERFDGMKTNIGEAGRKGRMGHEESLAERREARVGLR